MKKQICILGAAVLLAITCVMPVKAADSTVTFGADGKLNTPSSVGSTFNGMAPGETKSLTIQVKNENNNTADFYMSTDVVKALEESHGGAGAGYNVKLTAGGTVIYDSTAGGYTAAGTGSTEGLKDINASLNDKILIGTLAKGASTDVILTIGLDGEGVDKASYAASLGQIDFAFSAGYEDPTGPYTVYKVVTKSGETKYLKIFDQKVALAAQTGDTFIWWAGAVVILAGVVMVIMGLRRKAAGSDEN